MSDPSKQSRAMSLIIMNRQPFISQKRKPNNATCYQQHHHHFHDQDHHHLHRGSSTSSLTWICSSVAAFSSLHVAQMMMIMVVTMVIMMMVMMMVMMVMMKRVGPSPPPAGGAETLQSGGRCRQEIDHHRHHQHHDYHCYYRHYGFGAGWSTMDDAHRGSLLLQARVKKPGPFIYYCTDNAAEVEPSIDEGVCWHLDPWTFKDSSLEVGASS